MPSFSFTVAPKAKKKRATNTNTFKTEILKKNIIGIVWIDINAKYSVKVDDNTYKIHPKCFSCKGKRNIYLQEHTEKGRVCYIRDADSRVERNTCNFLPFAPGCIVSGNIVYSNLLDITYFDIKKVDYNYSSREAHNALAFYRKHQEEINTIIHKRKLDGITSSK